MAKYLVVSPFVREHRLHVYGDTLELAWQEAQRLGSQVQRIPEPAPKRSEGAADINHQTGAGGDASDPLPAVPSPKRSGRKGRGR